MDIRLVKCGSEDYIPEPESFDLCFTSPPYFNTEKYSDEESQSYLKYPDQDSWVGGFMGTTFQNCWRGLKDGHHMIINISNVKSFPDLTERIVEKAEEVGFVLVSTDELLLSLGTFSKRRGKSYKAEPVFVFQKRISKKFPIRKTKQPATKKKFPVRKKKYPVKARRLVVVVQSDGLIRRESDGMVVGRLADGVVYNKLKGRMI